MSEDFLSEVLGFDDEDLEVFPDEEDDVVPLDDLEEEDELPEDDY